MIFMNIKKRIRKLLNPNTYSNEAYVEFLIRGGAVIGEGTYFFSPKTTFVDPVKLFLIRIGKYCKITDGVTILAHDYSRSVVRHSKGINIGGSLPTTIGNNVFIGMKTTILMGSNIGNNVIIGANSVVSGMIPDNVVVAGNPARVICSLDDFETKRKQKCLEDAVACVKRIYENTGKLPTVQQMGDGFAWLYLPHCEATINTYPNFFNLCGDSRDDVVRDFLSSKPEFDSFDAFLTYAIESED